MSIVSGLMACLVGREFYIAACKFAISVCVSLQSRCHLAIALQWQAAAVTDMGSQAQQPVPAIEDVLNSRADEEEQEEEEDMTW